jgi:hypothetical protein
MCRKRLFVDAHLSLSPVSWQKPKSGFIKCVDKPLELDQPLGGELGWWLSKQKAAFGSYHARYLTFSRTRSSGTGSAQGGCRSPDQSSIRVRKQKGVMEALSV